MVRFNPDHPAYRYQGDYFLAWERQQAARDCPAPPCAQSMAAAGAAIAVPELVLIAASIAAAAALGYVAWRIWGRRGAARPA